MYATVMIETFASKRTQKLFNRQGGHRFPADMERRALRKLVMLHYAETVSDLREPPSNRLEALKGNRKGQHSIRINQQWRLCFVWKNNNAHDVEIVDYH